MYVNPVRMPVRAKMRFQDYPAVKLSATFPHSNEQHDAHKPMRQNSFNEACKSGVICRDDKLANPKPNLKDSVVCNNHQVIRAKY